jgi:ArsR family metal-binding transcriptional regulator
LLSVEEVAMLIEDYDLELFTPPCEPGAETWSAVARLKVDISQALPYLNATLRGAVYSHAAQALTWKKGGRSTAFHPYEIAAASLEDRAEAEKVIRGLVKLVNRTWERRDEIEPDFEMHQRPTPMGVFKLLPGTNCKGCGQPTCFTFALKLVAGQQRPEDCPPLGEPQFAGQLAQLRAMVGNTPALG